MEILELLVGLAQLADLCTCFLELFTIGANGSAFYTGIRTYKERKRTKEREAHHYGPPLKKPSWWPFAILVIVAVGVTILCVVKYTR